MLRRYVSDLIRILGKKINNQDKPGHIDCFKVLSLYKMVERVSSAFVLGILGAISTAFLLKMKHLLPLLFLYAPYNSKNRC